MTFTKPIYIFVFAEAEHYNIPEKGLRIISNTQSVDRWGHFSSHNGYVLLTFQVFLSRASAIAPQANEAVQSCQKNQRQRMFLKIWLCPTHSSIVGPERIFHGGMRIRTCTAQTYPVEDRGGFFS